MEKSKYIEFLKTKEIRSNASGFDLDKNDLNQNLYDWQKDVVAWAIRKGKACLFEDCGLGKTLQQLSFADIVSKKYNRAVLIVAPLAVATQTVNEGSKFGFEVNLSSGRTLKKARADFKG